MAHRGLCPPCYGFQARNPGTGPCAACGRDRHLKKDHCRSCWVQAGLDRPPPKAPRHRMLLPYVRQVRHHQLLLAGTGGVRDTVPKRPRRHGVGSGAPGLAAKPPPPPASEPRPSWLQLALPGLPPGYRHGRLNLRSDPLPDNPWLAWGLHVAHQLAELHGWSGNVSRAVNRSLATLLTDYTGADPLRASVIWPLLRQRATTAPTRTLHVLTTMGILVEDRPTTFDRWLARKLHGLAPAFAEPAAHWARTLHDGGPRSLPRNDVTARNYLAAVLPALQHWATRYDHPREVTRDDVLDHAATLQGRQRQYALTTLRSLFAWAKKNNLVFGDPAARVKVGRLEHGVFQPLEPEDIDQTITAATTPQARLYIALAAVHAARHSQIRALTLDDVDLPNRRLTIDRRTRPLDDLTHRLLTDWLTHRRTTWPGTANPHLMISAISANGTAPVSHAWLNRILRGLPATLEALRIDRQLDEALTNGADPLHLAVVFGLNATTAIRYADSARQLLRRPHEHAPPSSPRT